MTIPEQGRVLVTGGSGFLGSFVIERLLGRGFQPTVVDVREPRWTPQVPWIRSDVGERSGIRAAIEEVAPDAIVHLAGVLGTSETFDDPQETVRTNVIGTINVLEACRDRRIRYVGVETGSLWPSPYAISKHAAREFALAYRRAYGFPVSVMRLFNAYGPRQEGTGRVTKIIPRFVVNALRGEPLPVYGDGEQTIDLPYVEDCAEIFALAVERAPGEGEVIEVGTGVPISVLEVARRVLDLVGGGDLRFLPMRIGEGPQYPVADTRLARELLGFVPPATPDRFAETMLWYREHVFEPELST